MIALVLVLLGSVGLVLVLANDVGRNIKENVRVSAYLKDNVNEVEMLQLRKKLEAEPFVQATEYISKDEARQRFLGGQNNEDPSEILGEYNPLPASYEIRLNAAWVQADSIEAITSRLERYREIKLAQSRKDVVSRLNDDFQAIGFGLVGVAVIILLIVVTLIDKTIRLAMYSNRFLIRSMQLVGATRGFITGPYMRRGLLNGLIAGLVAVSVLFGLAFAAGTTFQSLPFPPSAAGGEAGKLVAEWLKFAGLFGGVIATGMLISWWSTQRAVAKYLRMKLDELY